MEIFRVSNTIELVTPIVEMDDLIEKLHDSSSNLLGDNNYSIDYFNSDNEFVIKAYTAVVADFTPVSVTLMKDKLLIVSWVSLDNFRLVIISVTLSILLFIYGEVSLLSKCLISSALLLSSILYLLYISNLSNRTVINDIKKQLSSVR